jgi:hypothetical protein
LGAEGDFGVIGAEVVDLVFDVDDEEVVGDGLP